MAETSQFDLKFTIRSDGCLSSSRVFLFPRSRFHVVIHKIKSLQSNRPIFLNEPKWNGIPLFISTDKKPSKVPSFWSIIFYRFLTWNQFLIESNLVKHNEIENHDKSTLKWTRMNNSKGKLIVNWLHSTISHRLFICKTSICFQSINLGWYLMHYWE